MPTITEVANQCLLALDRDPIQDIDGTGTTERFLRSVLPLSTRACLEEGDWDFALATMKLAQTTAPSFGYSYAYNKPADWVKTSVLSPIASMAPTEFGWADRQGVIQTDEAELYMLYVSAAAIGSPGRWSGKFATFHAYDLAHRVFHKFASSDAKRKEIWDLRTYFKYDALGFDGSHIAPQRPPHGRLVAAHYGARR